MRPLGKTTTLSARSGLASVGAAALGLSLLAAPAGADETDVPRLYRVRSAQAAADDAARALAAVRADLAVTQIVLDRAAVAAQQAAEAFNGARYDATRARAEAREARTEERAAIAHVERVRLAYVEMVRGSLGSSRGLQALSSIMAADGVGEMLELTTSYRIAGSTLDARHDELSQARDQAARASAAADTARAMTVEARDTAAVRRDEAAAAAAVARAETAVAQSRTQELVAELARLQGISVAVAEERREALALQAAEEAQAEEDQAEEDQAEARAAAAAEAPAPALPSASPTGPDPAPDPAPPTTALAEPGEPAQPTEPSPSPDPDPTQAPAPAPAPVRGPAPAAAPPAPSSGAQAAIAFARAQLGERYVWAAAGPDTWDCSGLTMGAWAAGGKSLPHYSVAQYDASTPISASQRRPGDLVFWASSSDPSSIYHVALYVGDDRIIHAPRTGRPVSEDSLYYWIAPSFYARP